MIKTQMAIFEGIDKHKVTESLNLFIWDQPIKVTNFKSALLENGMYTIELIYEVEKDD